MKIISTAIATASAFVAMAAPLAAQDQVAGETLGAKSPVTLSGDVLAVKTVTDANGDMRTEMVAPDLIVPGDRLVFGTDYANNGVEPVENFTVTNPLPAAVRLAPDAAAGLTVSVDGGQNWGTLSQLTVTDADGADRSASHGDVTHVRWTLASIAPGENGRLEYPAIIR